MNPKAVFAVLAVAIGCSSFAVAQRPAKMNLGEGEAKARKILLEKAAKEGKVSDAAAPAAGTVTHWGGVISWGRSQPCVQHGGTQSGEGFVDIPRAYLCEWSLHLHGVVRLPVQLHPHTSPDPRGRNKTVAYSSRLPA